MGGAVYLLYEVSEVAPAPTGNAQERAFSAQRPQRASSRPRSNLRRRNVAPSPTGSGLRSRTGRAPPSAAAPFSKSWREQATPDLSGPSPSSEGGQGGAPSSDLLGPAIASSPSSVGFGSEGVQTKRGNGGSGWKAEARRLAGRARALSSELGRRGRESSDAEGAPSSSREVPEAASASANSDPGTPPDPNQVPIGGLEWLAAAGAAYALHRLGLQSEER